MQTLTPLCTPTTPTTNTPYEPSNPPYTPSPVQAGVGRAHGHRCPAARRQAAGCQAVPHWRLLRRDGLLAHGQTIDV
eukprot:scaffold17180_cov87-Phaeocystis_antarctica.AAC.2